MRASKRQATKTLFFALVAAFCVSTADAAPLTAANSAWNVNRNGSAATPSEYTGSWEGHRYFPSPPDWREIGVYSLVTDRFSDGDPANNEGRYRGFDVRDFQMRQGGDFRGLAGKLDYIKALGFRAIWISPIFQNRFNSYHGYGQIDFTLLDDRFGTLDDLRHLTSEAHNRGMFVIVDIIVNHLDNLYYEEGFQNGGAPFRFHTGEYRLHLRNQSESYADFKAENTFDPKGRYCSVYSGDGSLVEDDGPAEGSYWKSDFHHNGTLDLYADPWNINLGKIYGMYDDLRLCSSTVQEKIIAMTKSLIASTDIDGIRMDTPMQVPLPFFKVWSPAIREFAKSLGKNNFPIFGETFASRTRTATMVGRGKTPAMYHTDNTIDDIPVFDGGIDYSFFAGGIEPIFRFSLPGSGKYPFEIYKIERGMLDLSDPQSKESMFQMLSFIGSHDQRRLRNLSDGSRKLEAASALLAIWPGVPIWYQGDEQGLCSAGTGLEGHARESMMESIAWSKLPSCEPENPANRDNFDYANPFFKTVSELFEIRQTYPRYFASDEMEITDFVSENDAGAILLQRGGASDYGLAALNFTRSMKTLKLPAGGRRFVDAITGTALAGTELPIGPYDFKILVPEEGYKPLRPRLVSMTPEHDTRAAEKVAAVTIEFSTSMSSESVQSGIVCPGGAPPKKFQARDSNRTFSFECALSCGVNTVIVAGGIKSSSGRELGAAVRSRVLFGSDDNILVNPKATFDRNLVVSDDGTVTSSALTLRHHACGASFLRVSTDRGRRWGSWEPYAPESKVKVHTSNGWQSVMVQYWAAGSAAYIVEGGVDYYKPPWKIVAPSAEHEPMHAKPRGKELDE